MSAAATSGRFWFASPPPDVAVEIGGTQVTAVAIGDQGRSPVVTGHASEPLPPGLVAPSLNAVNVHDERALGEVVRTVLQRLGGWTRRIGLVLPDAVAKVSLVRFEKVPEKTQDLDQLIRWQVRKTAPFRIEDAQVSWQPGARVAEGGREFLVVMARTDVLQSYERACAAAGVHAGLVDLASFGQVNAVLAGDAGSRDWLLVSITADAGTLAVVRDEVLVFYRHRHTEGEADLPDLVHQTAMYHEDRLGGGGFARVVLAGASLLGPDDGERLRRALEARIGAPVHAVDFRSAAAIRDRIAAGPEILDALAAPVGLLLGERAAPRRAAGVAS